MSSRALLITSLALLVACEPEETPLPMVIADLVIENANVIAMETETVGAGYSVYIKDGRILMVAGAGEFRVPQTTERVDATGKYLLPGLADMHVHAGAPNDMALYVANGVTLVRNMWGFPETLALRKRIEAGEVLGPRIVTAGALVDGDPPIWGEFSGVAKTPEDARRLLEDQQAAGFDFFKVYALLKRDVFDAIAAHSKEIGFPFAGHVPDAVPLEHALASGMSSNEHLTGWNAAVRLEDGPYLTWRQEPNRAKRRRSNIELGQKIAAGELAWSDLFDLEEVDRLAALAAENESWNAPTMSVLKRLVTSRRQAETEFERPEMQYISPQTRASWNPTTDFRLKDYTDEQLEAQQIFFEWDKEILGRLHAAGAPLLVGTDAPNPFVMHGFAIHEELQFFVDSGLTPYEALRAATVAPAEFLGERDDAGTIARGKRADLMLLDSNPLEDIGATRGIVGVVTSGRWHSRAALDEKLAQIAASYQTPEDWFANVPALPDEWSTHYDVTFNGTATGAIRARKEDDRITGQYRFGTGEQAVLARYELRLDGQQTVRSLTYIEESPSNNLNAAVQFDGMFAKLGGVAGDGMDVNEALELTPEQQVLVLNACCLAPMLKAIDDLAVGEERVVEAVVLESFGGMRLEAESWKVLRNPDEDGRRVYVGSVQRRTEFSPLTIVVDDNGLQRLRVELGMGVLESVRRD